jgi:hypothetical protein
MDGLESKFAGGGGRGLVRHPRVSNPHLVPRLRARGTEKARPESHVTREHNLHWKYAWESCYHIVEDAAPRSQTKLRVKM